MECVSNEHCTWTVHRQGYGSNQMNLLSGEEEVLQSPSVPLIQWKPPFGFCYIPTGKSGRV
jgi:hypothetical protein